MVGQESNIRQSPQRFSEDEASLIDLAQVLIRRKTWIIGTFLLCIFGALAFVLLKTHQYTYTTSILIGEFGMDKYVTSAKGAKSVLESRIVPVVEREFVDKRGIQVIPFRTNVIADEGNNFVNIVSEAPENRRALVAEFHGAMAEALSHDHSSKLSLLERESSIKLDNLRATLATQQEQLKGLESLMIQLGQAGTELQGKGEITASAQSDAEGMQATISSSNHALTLVLSQLQLSDQLGNKESRINELEGEIEAEELKRSWLKPTRVVNLATASVETSGAATNVILFLSVVIGIILGVLIALIREFIGRLRA